jgi:DNA-binding transcriptional regulator YbjK
MQGRDGAPAAADDEATADAPRRGRPRSEKARLAILEAAAELLLARGLSAVSMDAVAERAGVSKARRTAFSCTGPSTW